MGTEACDEGQIRISSLPMPSRWAMDKLEGQWKESF